MWAKIIKNNKIIKDMIVANQDKNLRRTQKVFQAIDEVCDTYDLSKPIWLDSTINDFKIHRKTRFTQDNFIDQIDFDYLEIEMIEED